jgi:alpha-tubulin suppressor-like RCC1 family protein
MPQWKQYSGIWTPTQQAQALAAGTWTGIPSYSGFVWGFNSAGELGQDDRINRSSPTQIGALTTWLQLTGAYETKYGVFEDNTFYSWGNNGSGRLAQGDIIKRSSPTQVGALTNWLSVSGGQECTGSVKTDGTLWTWGANGYGNLGHNNTTSLSSPVQVGSDTDWQTPVGARRAIFCIKTDGSLWAIGGQNTYGQLGLSLDEFARVSSPTQVGAGTDWYKLSGWGYATAAIKTDGTLWTWGYNSYGQLGSNIGSPALEARSSPVQIGADTDWAEVSVGNAYVLATKTDGTLWSWGRGNINGQLGQNNNINYSSPVQIGALTTWTNVKMLVRGGGLASKTDGSLWAWGYNFYGEITGIGGNVGDVSSPVQIGSDTYWSLENVEPRTSPAALKITYS